MSDLHERLTAAVQQRLMTAQAAATEEGPFDGTGIVVMRLHDHRIRTVTLPSNVADFLAANDPATVIRHCERDLRVLERHRHVPNGGWCGGDIFVGHPCDEIRDLAAAYDIEVTE